MTTRQCTIEDIPQALVLIREFYAEVINDFGIYLNISVAREEAAGFVNTTLLLENNGQVVGLISGKVIRLPLDTEWVYHEAVWYVRKQYRSGGIKLYKALEKYCKEQGIKKIIMVSMSNSKDDKLGRFYNRLGFQMMEKHYIKNIGG